MAKKKQNFSLIYVIFTMQSAEENTSIEQLSPKFMPFINAYNYAQLKIRIQNGARKYCTWLGSGTRAILPLLNFSREHIISYFGNSFIATL